MTTAGGRSTDVGSADSNAAGIGRVGASSDAPPHDDVELSVKGLADPVLAVAPDGTLHYANDAAAEALGETRPI